MWDKRNNNPFGRETQAADCVVRAIGWLFGISWEQALRLLVDEAVIQGLMPNQEGTFAQVLRSRGWRYFNVTGKKPTVRQFAADHPKGKYLAVTATHAVPVIDGNYIDSWDCGARKVEDYYTAPGSELLRKSYYLTTPKWEPVFEPDAAMLSLIGDGAIKINQAIPGYLTRENLRDLTGVEGGA